MTIAPSVLAQFVDDIAFVAEAQPAATPREFADQLETAARNLTFAGIHGAEGLETAARYLADAIASTGTERSVLLNRAVGYLAGTAEVVARYRLMV
jgi:hypothetical protein